MPAVAAAPIKPRYMLQHVWKTGGSEFCFLVRANGWTTPPTHNCYLDVDYGWPTEDYDFIANERPAMVKDGKIVVDFGNASAGVDLEVHDVKWITILRHPYSRTLSHYAHMLALNQTKDFTLPEFLTHHSPRNIYHFWNFVPNQQTEWHCGTFECSHPELRPQHLADAMAILEQFHVILMLEDMKDRLQMRHVLNLTKVEILEHINATNADHHIQTSLYRRPLTNWYKEMVPYLGPLVFTRDDNHTSTWDDFSLRVMSAMGYHNDMDLQLYGYARKLCTERGIAIQNSLKNQQRVSTRADFLSSKETSWSSPSPTIISSLQLSSLAIVSLWMLMLPSVRRLLAKLPTRQLFRTSWHQR
jgi:hypothetical protein